MFQSKILSFLDHVFETKLFIFSCLALNDLLRGRPLDDIIDKLPEIWETLFRVQDDIKVKSAFIYRIA